MFSLMYVKKFTSFCQALKKMHTKKLVPFFLPHSVELVGRVPFVLNIPPYKTEYIYII